MNNYDGGNKQASPPMMKFYVLYIPIVSWYRFTHFSPVWYSKYIPQESACLWSQCFISPQPRQSFEVEGGMGYSMVMVYSGHPLAFHTTSLLHDQTWVPSQQYKDGLSRYGDLTSIMGIPTQARQHHYIKKAPPGTLVRSRTFSHLRRACSPFGKATSI